MPQRQIPEDFNFNSFGGTPESQEIEDTDTPIRENSDDIDYQEEREITNNPDTAFVKEELQEMEDIMASLFIHSTVNIITITTTTKGEEN